MVKGQGGKQRIWCRRRALNSAISSNTRKRKWSTEKIIRQMTSVPKAIGYLPQQPVVLAAQRAELPLADPQLPMGQLVAHEEAAPRAHEPPQFSKHPDCEQDALLGQIHDPSCPKAIPIPASSRTIDTIASFFI